MKEISGLNLPDNLRYSDDHEWLELGGETVRVGISDYAQDQLGDITFVEMPEVGDTLGQREEFGTLESTKAVSEMLMPVSGEITAVNMALEETPGLVNEDPYGKGWIIEIKPDSPADLDSLMTRDEYMKMLEGIE